MLEEPSKVETDNTNCDDQDQYRNSWLLRGLGLLFVFLTVLGIAFAFGVLWPQFQDCWGQWAGRLSWVERLLASSLHSNECLSPNEIGDFLAGIFATLAFLWLLFTVFLQATELRAQRKELQLTRDIAEQSKEAIKAQAKEARRSGSYFKKQTDILEQEQRERDERAALTLLEARLERLRMLHDVGVSSTRYKNQTHRESLTNLADCPNIWDFIRSYEGHFGALDWSFQGQHVRSVEDFVVRCYEICDLIQACLDLAPQLSLAEQVRLVGLDLPERITAIRELANFVQANQRDT